VKKEKLSREEIIKQWLDLIPVRQYEHDTEESGTVIVLVPHSENWFTRRLLPSAKKPAQKIHLDKIGSLVWQQFDGQNSIKDICNILQQDHGDQEDSIEERTVLFAQQLYKQKFIKVLIQKDPSGTNKSP
jgi:hypothetical protein